MSANSLASVIIGGGVVAASAAFYYLLNNKSSKNELVLSTTEFRKFPLIEKTILSHNSARYRFGLPNKDDILGLPTGQHISIMIEVDEKQVLRSYTPTSNDFDKGYFELVIKTYPTGVLSKHIDTLNVGDTISVRGPKGAFKYTPNMIKEFGMIAGGTGITPMFQVIKAILTNPADKTKVNLIYANVSEDDILLKEELDQLAKDHSEQFSIYYVLNNPPSEWNGGVGFVTKEMIEERFMKASQNVKVLLCGPPPMIKAMSQYCEELSYDKPRALSKMEDMVFKF